MHWNEIFMLSDGRTITRHHELLYDDSLGIFIGKILDDGLYMGYFQPVETPISELGINLPFMQFYPTQKIIVPGPLRTLSFRPMPFASPPPPLPPRPPRPNTKPDTKPISNIYNDPFIKDYLLNLLSEIAKFTRTPHTEFFIKGGSGVALWKGIKNKTAEELSSDIDATLLIDPELDDAQFYKTKLELTVKIIKTLKTYLSTYRDEVLASYSRNSLIFDETKPPYDIIPTIIGDEQRLKNTLKPYQNSIEQNLTAPNNKASIPFIVSYNPALHGQYFSFISIKTRTKEPIPLVEITIPYKGYSDHIFFWKTHRTALLPRTITFGGKPIKITIPIQAALQMLFNQRYSAARARTDENREKRTKRGNYLRNEIIGADFKKHRENLIKMDDYYETTDENSEEHPKNYPFENFMNNISDHLHRYTQRNKDQRESKK